MTDQRYRLVRCFLALAWAALGQPERGSELLNEHSWEIPSYLRETDSSLCSPQRDFAVAVLAHSACKPDDPRLALATQHLSQVLNAYSSTNDRAWVLRALGAIYQHHAPDQSMCELVLCEVIRNWSGQSLVNCCHGAARGQKTCIAVPRRNRPTPHRPLAMAWQSARNHHTQPRFAVALAKVTPEYSDGRSAPLNNS